MTNIEIVYSEILKNNIMGKEELDKYIEKNFKLPDYLTFIQWKNLGYKIKKGEHAIIKTKLWYKTNKKIKTEKGEETQETFILVNSNLFSKNQVERIEA